MITLSTGVMRCGVRLNSKGCSGHGMSGLICGLDVHKAWCEATVIDWFGNIVDSRRISRDELGSFLSGSRVSLVAIESSTYVHPLCNRLRSDGFRVVVAHPKKTRLIAENRLKSDQE
ncbi:hypothetical protein HRbin02_00738 [Candidatus Calditenuaceae archaeon HR02]|nr:hypothetical protein HRbin02_00738 [Candidatus Calditenuaceae archaeon HR02]